MKRITMTSLGLGVALAVAAGSGLAEPPEKKSTPRADEAMQIKIDRKTGRKTAGDDSAAPVSSTRKAAPSSADPVVPNRTLPAERHADGSLSARLGEDAMKVLVLSIDEEGEKKLTHQSAEDAKRTIESTSREER